MRKRILKKYLDAFGCTLKNGKVCGKKSHRRHPFAHYLNGNHPLTVRHTKRFYREQARVLPALLKAPIGKVNKAAMARRVSQQQPATLPPWVEKGGKPRLRLRWAVRHCIAEVSAKGLTEAQHQAALDAQLSALFRSRPQVLGKRLQSNNRMKR